MNVDYKNSLPTLQHSSLVMLPPVVPPVRNNCLNVSKSRRELHLPHLLGQTLGASLTTMNLITYGYQLSPLLGFGGFATVESEHGNGAKTPVSQARFDNFTMYCITLTKLCLFVHR